MFDTSACASKVWTEEDSETFGRCHSHAAYLQIYLPMGNTQVKGTIYSR